MLLCSYPHLYTCICVTPPLLRAVVVLFLSRAQCSWSFRVSYSWKCVPRSVVGSNDPQLQDYRPSLKWSMRALTSLGDPLDRFTCARDNGVSWFIAFAARIEQMRWWSVEALSVSCEYLSWPRGAKLMRSRGCCVERCPLHWGEKPLYVTGSRSHWLRSLHVTASRLGHKDPMHL